MNIDPKAALSKCETLMLDMDGTILDLAFDNYLWLQLVPKRYAETHDLTADTAREKLLNKFREMMGRLEWYCLDHWSDFLGFDVGALHRENLDRIAYLPGAEAFLREVRERDLRLLLVTNSHLETLDIKDGVTGVAGYFDNIYSSHSFGVPKETQDFWQGLKATEDFDPETTVFIDDTAHVLDSAREYGIGGLLEIARPDTSAEAKRSGRFTAIDGLQQLL